METGAFRQGLDIVLRREIGVFWHSRQWKFLKSVKKHYAANQARPPGEEFLHHGLLEGEGLLPALL